MPAMLHIYVTLDYCCSLHIDPTVLYISVQTQLNAAFNLPCYRHTHVRNNNVLQIPHICHIPKLLSVHQWRKYAKCHISADWPQPCDQECCIDNNNFDNANNDDDAVLTALAGHWPYQPTGFEQKGMLHQDYQSFWQNIIKIIMK